MCRICGSPALDHSPVLGRRRLLGLAAWGAAAALAPSAALAAGQAPPPKPQNVLTPEQALERLQAGNRRYVEGLTKGQDFAVERATLALGQNPYAAVLGCADSRVTPEFVFDSSLGDVFAVRVAGNVLTDAGQASLEYATAVLKTPLVVVLGHDACGAIDAAIKVAKTGEPLPGRLPDLMEDLRPAVEEAKSKPGDLLENAIQANVRRMVEKLKAGSVVAPLVAQKKVAVVGAIYRLKTGRVDFVV